MSLYVTYAVVVGCYSIQYSLGCFGLILLLMQSVSHNTFPVLRFPKILPLVHCQYSVQLWTYFVSYDVSSADYKMPDWYIGIPGPNEKADAHQALPVPPDQMYP